jgi:plasmid replication initiation protein
MFSPVPCPTIVHANALLDASYSLTTTETRLIALASTKIDSRKTNIGEICITVAEFELAYGVASNNSYTELKNAVRSIMRKPIRLNDGDDSIELAWFIKNQYKTGDEGSHVIFQFSPLIEPYLFELKERFTSINFEFSSKLNTPFSFRLYQWLKKIERIDNNQNNHVRSIILDISWMKDKAQLTGYERWDNFNLRLIKPAVDKINVNTDISVFYEPIKIGRKITAVKFSYVMEKDESCIKPMRPRLYRRPKVIKNSHEEGIWMRKNLALLLEYETQLKRYDDKEKLALTDLRKIAEYASICDRITEDRARKEIELRTIK